VTEGRSRSVALMLVSPNLSGAHATVTTVSDIIETLTATCRERKWLGIGLSLVG